MRVVKGDEAPLGGVAQVIFHGVQVVEVGLQVREHQDRREEEDGEGQVEVEREVEENQRQQHMCMAWRWNDRLKELEPMWCDTSSRQGRRLTVRCCAHLCRSRVS